MIIEKIKYPVLMSNRGYQKIKPPGYQKNQMPGFDV
jgi:hypothetical protein